MLFSSFSYMMWTISKAAVEFETTKETIGKGLRANDIDVQPRQTYTTKQIFCALAGDLKYERTRRERAEADKAEIETKMLTGSVIPRDDVAVFILKTFGPVRERLMGLPGRIAAQLGLSPEQRKALDSEVAATLTFCRENIPPKKEIEQ
jgi:hypothetical protein